MVLFTVMANCCKLEQKVKMFINNAAAATEFSSP